MKCFDWSWNILVFIVMLNGVKPSPRNVEKILNCEINTVHDARRFLGLANFYRKFILCYALITQPLNLLLKKERGGAKVKLTEQQVQSVLKTKKALTSYPVLRHPDFTARFHLFTDASDQLVMVSS